MSFSGKDILPLIQVLIENSNTYTSDEQKPLKQATFRAILSRSYYSAFLAVRSHVGLDNDQSGSVHANVGDALHKIKPSLANSLSSLKRYRTQADYNMATTFNLQSARDSLRQSKKVIDGLNSN